MPSAKEEDTDDSTTLTDIRRGKWDNSSWTATSKKSLYTDEMDGISPLMLAKSKEVDDFDLDNTPKPPNPYLTKMMPTKRSSASSSPSTFQSHRRSTMNSLNDGNNLDSDSSPRHEHRSKHHHSKHHVHGMNHVIDEVVSWLQAEKAKQKARKAQKKTETSKSKGRKSPSAMNGLQTASASQSRRSSDASEAGLDLQELESILERNFVPVSSHVSSRRASSLALHRYGSRSSQRPRRMSMYKSSDTEVYDDDLLVPNCDVVLDNSKLLSSFSKSTTETENDPTESKDSDAWSTFKYEIVRLSHTLKLTGWRQVPLENSGEISVERLSGALTNAVYVVTRPSELPVKKGAKKKKKPLKLLLRIYGPNVEHLIDREGELRILKRLARKQIGPRMLGTFRNGRFEEYLHARPLKPQEMREPDTSKQIAKRMRELHDGIELLAEERLGGPFMWRNWDKWLDRAESITTRLDSMIRRRNSNLTSPTGSSWRRHGFVCGTPWELFRSTVEQYRRQLDNMYGSKARLRDQLVFSHNDTQYGNILRVEPPGESPLLLPANQHKQLVVIDFEYSNANVPGLEFANHFTEWCYNYHDPTRPFACNTAHYPTLEEQRRFIRAYIVHQPEHTPAAMSTPRFTPIHSNPSLSSLSSLTLDQRNPHMYGKEEDPIELIQNAMPRPNSDATVNEEIQRLMHETRMWRVANSAQWVVWGIVQATLPEELNDLEEETAPSKDDANVDPSGGSTDAADTVVADEQPFDYLSYARERAMFFWGDCLQFGLVSEDDLGEAVMKDIKIVPY